MPVLSPSGLQAGRRAREATARGDALSLAGGWTSFSTLEEIQLEPELCTSHLAHTDAALRYPDAVGVLTSRREPFAGINLDRPRLVGVINVTPDSFSDGWPDSRQAIDQAHRLVEAGAEILDIGGESTRPGSEPTSVSEELRRVIPVIESASRLGVAVSVDTRKSVVMREAIAAGADIVNDVSALTADPDALGVIVDSGASVILMHMQGTPASMQQAPSYRLASADIFLWLQERVLTCATAGIPSTRIAVDPGIGFGKTDAHNLEILDRATLFHGLGCAVMFGVSRKSFIGRIADVDNPADRVPGTIMATAIALSRGVQMHRVHDVAEARQAIDIWQAIIDSR